MSMSGEKSQVDLIIEAVSTGNLNRIKRLGKEMDNGKGISEILASIEDSHGNRLLHIAAAKGRTNVCKYLLEELKFDVSQKDRQECIPLFHAITQRHLNTVVYLVEKGSDLAPANSHNLTSLHIAAGLCSTHTDTSIRHGDIKIVNLLLSKGLNVNDSSSFGTSLTVAAMGGASDIIKTLLDHGASPNIYANSGDVRTPLEYSVLAKSLSCTKLLLQAGAYPDANGSGSTPLSLAAEVGGLKLIKCLLEAGADPNLTTDTGEKPLEIAARIGNHQEVRILFPVTSPIPECSDWSITGIKRYVHSEQAKHQREIKLKEKHLKAKFKIENALKSKEYIQAVIYLQEAIEADSSDATLYSHRSLCFSCLEGGGDQAWADAKTCILLRPDWPEGYYRAGVALSLLGRFGEAADAFLKGLELNPDDKEFQDAFRQAVELKMNSFCIEEEEW
ncbi:hypothetical protein ACHQM5_014902 [Ranunculus cassubicifolius]